MAEPARFLLMFVVVPLWLAAGVADWWCHRRTAIERTSGSIESGLHLLMSAEVGLAVLAVLFLEVNAGVLLLCLGLYLVHQATAYCDLRYTHARREIGPLEQQVHSFLEVLPLTALALLAVAHWEQAQALFGAGPSAARFAPAWKETPVPGAYVAGLLASCTLLNVVPFIEEWLRTRRVERFSHKPSPANTAAHDRGRLLQHP